MKRAQEITLANGRRVKLDPDTQRIYAEWMDNDTGGGYWRYNPDPWEAHGYDPDLADQADAYYPNGNW